MERPAIMLQKQLDKLSKIINLGINEEHLSELYYYLQSISIQLKINSLYVMGNCTKICCALCNTSLRNEYLINLPCHHNICSDICMQNLLLQTDLNSIIDNQVKCPCSDCPYLIPPGIILKMVGGEEGLQNLIDQAFISK